MAYLKACKDNRLEGDTDNPIWAYPSTEMKPQAGDIVVQAREGSGATWDSFENKKCHGDVVVAATNAEITVVGGNLSNSVGRRKVPLDGAGKIKAADYFAMIRIGAGVG